MVGARERAAWGWMNGHGWVWDGQHNGRWLFFVLFCKLKQIKTNCNKHTTTSISIPIVSFICCINNCSPFHRILTEEQLMGVHGNYRWWPRLGEVDQRPKSGRCTVGGRGDAWRWQRSNGLRLWTWTLSWLRSWNLQGEKPLLVGDEAMGMRPLVFGHGHGCLCFGRRMRSGELDVDEDF